MSMTQRIFLPVEAEEFYAEHQKDPKTGAIIEYAIPLALAAMQSKGYTGATTPMILAAKSVSERSHMLWLKWLTATTGIFQGYSAAGNPYVVITHGDHYFTNPDNVRTAIAAGVHNGAGEIPQSEFQKYLDMKDDKNVFVIDHHVLAKSHSGSITVDEAYQHPLPMPLAGGSDEADAYLKQHKNVIGKNIWIYHTNDLNKGKVVGRLAVLGNYVVNFSFDSNNFLDNGARFVGVPLSIAEGDAKKIIAPTLEQIFAILEEASEE